MSKTTTEGSLRDEEVPSLEDYVAVAGMLRGMAGEMAFVMGNLELPDEFQIVARHVDALGKKIDFELQGPRGRKAKLEVKAWSRRSWERELATLGRAGSASAAGHMIAQLRAARATRVPVYLAVLDVMADRLADLRRLLDLHRLDDVIVVTFPENKLERIFGTLRAGFAIPAGVTPALADQLAEGGDE